MKKVKVTVIFPHIPNPRMVKRVKALLTICDVHVIYWDRDLGNVKMNELPNEAKVTVIKRKTNEGNPLKRVFTTARVIKEIISVVRNIKPEILYLSKTDMLFAGYIYRKLHGNKCKLIYEVSDLHSLMIDNHKEYYKTIVSKILVKIEKTFCKSVSLLIITSEEFYDRFYKKMISKDNVVFMPNTPEPEVFIGFERRQRDRFTVGFIGAVRYADQLEMLIDASVEVGIDVLIAGGGKDYSRIKKYARNFENVKVYGEYKYADEIKELYEQVDCIYSVYDTKMTNVQIALPNRLYEAAYTATPLIVSKNTYLGDLVERYGIGKTISANSRTDLADAIRDLKNNPEYFEHIRAKAEIFKADWNLSKYNKNLLDMINSIL